MYEAGKKMKRILKLFCLTIISGFVTSCSNDDEKFGVYYSYKDNLKGIEVYCWEKNDSWYSGILPGTNRLKTVSEVQWLQDNLPCPISQMEKILKTYDDSDIYVCIVSIPPTDDELEHKEDTSETYYWLIDQLGL